MSRFQPGNSSVSDTIARLRSEKEEAERELDYYKKMVLKQEDEIHNVQARNDMFTRKMRDSQKKRLEEAREQTARTERKLADLQGLRKKERQKYLENLKKLSASRREASSTALVPTVPITSRSGQKGFLNNMKRVMGLALKNPGKVYVALTGALAALGMTVIQQQEQLNQHRTDMTRLQNQLYDQLNRTNYYRQYHDMRERAGLYRQPTRGRNPLSRAMNAKDLDEHNRNIRQQQKRLGPPPDKR